MTKFLISLGLLIACGGTFGGYVYMHGRQPLLVDSDSKNIYERGFISRRTLLGYRVLEGDSCMTKNGKDLVLEKFLWDVQGDRDVPGRAPATYDVFECPGRCEDGRCLR